MSAQHLHTIAKETRDKDFLRKPSSNVFALARIPFKQLDIVAMSPSMKLFLADIKFFAASIENLDEMAARI